MAKTVGPLQSFSASGKVADSLIFQNQNGRNIVRKYFQPSNPRTPPQQTNRLIIAALAKSFDAADKGKPWLNDLLQAVPAGQTWTTYAQNFFTERYGRGAAGVQAAHTEFLRLTDRTLWESFANRIGIFDTVFLDAIDGARTLEAGFSLLFPVKLALDIRARTNLFPQTYYDIDVNDWTLDTITLFKSDFTNRIPTP